MHSWNHGEKKGLGNITQEDILAQNELYQLSKNIEESTPKVTKFKIKRNSVLPLLSNVEDIENIDPSIITETKPSKLTRAEWPLMFDVASMTRKIAEEEIMLTEIQFGQVQDVQDDEENDYEGEYDEGGEE